MAQARRRRTGAHVTRAYAIGRSIGERIRRALIATRDILDDALITPSGTFGEVPEAMTRKQLIAAFKRERDHALDLEREIDKIERERIFGRPS